VGSTISDDGNGLRVFREAGVLIFAWNFIGEMLNGLMRVQGAVEHVQLLLKDSQVPAIRTVLDVHDGVLMVLDLLNNTGVFDVEDTQHSRLKTSCKEEPLGVRSQAKAVVVRRIAELIRLLQLLGVPQPNGEVAAQGQDAVGEVVIDYLANVFCVGPDDGSIVVVGQIQD
jgi:hypothetical protein